MLSQPHQFDRFIPNRYFQTLEPHQSKQNESLYVNFLQQNICPTSRVLNFSNSNRNNSQCCHLLKRNESKNKIMIANQKEVNENYLCWGSKGAYKKLRSSQDSEKILDVPCIKDDFYLNVLDWSQLGPLAVALDNQAYLYTPSYIMELCKLLDGTYISSLKFHQQTISLGTSDGKILIFDIQKNHLIRQLSQHNKRVSALSFNSRNILYSGSKDKNILINDIRMKQATINKLNAHKGQICALEGQPASQNFMASGSNDNTVAIWDLRNHQLLRKYTEHKGAVKAISWCAWKSGVIATAGGAGDKTIRIWNVNQNQDLACKKTDSQISSLKFSSSTGHLISSHGLSNNNIRFWKPQLLNNQALTLEKVKELNGHTGRILNLAMSPAQNMLCSVSADETLRFWRFIDSTEDPWKSQELTTNRWSIKLK